MPDITPVRDPDTDARLTPQTAVLALIDYAPEVGKLKTLKSV